MTRLPLGRLYPASRGWVRARIASPPRRKYRRAAPTATSDHAGLVIGVFSLCSLAVLLLGTNGNVQNLPSIRQRLAERHALSARNNAINEARELARRTAASSATSQKICK